jgi:pimeloyl-ACP methyl ester carboxylesterase
MTADPSSSPEAVVRTLDQTARHTETPIRGGGTMRWRQWGVGPNLVLLHGGYGSWRHWIRNIPTLAKRHTVLAPDMPGFGDSDLPPEPVTVNGIATTVALGARQIVGEGSYRVAGFSFGSLVGCHMAGQINSAVSHLVLVSCSRLARDRSPQISMNNWRQFETEQARNEAHRRNLAQMLIQDAGKIDRLAVFVQSENTSRARIRSTDIAKTSTLLACLQRTSAKVDAIWGGRDVLLNNTLDQARETLLRCKPEARLTVIPDAGHWVQYESNDAVNETLDTFFS